MYHCIMLKWILAYEQVPSLLTSSQSGPLFPGKVHDKKIVDCRVERRQDWNAEGIVTKSTADQEQNKSSSSEKEWVERNNRIIRLYMD